MRLVKLGHTILDRKRALTIEDIIFAAEKANLKAELQITSLKHVGQTRRQKWPLRNHFSIFYPFELKVCRMEDRVFQTIVRFLLLDFNRFWRENDVVSLTGKLNFN